MAIPQAQAGADQYWAYSSLPKLVTLAGVATNPPTLAWEWTMLSVPYGSSANIGVNNDFLAGVSTLQNPQFTCDRAGAYVLQLRAQNVDGWSDPAVDMELGQTAVFIRTQKLGLLIPGPFMYGYGEELNETLLALESAYKPNVTDDAQMKRAAADYVAFPLKFPAGKLDRVLIEDPLVAGAKSYIEVGKIPNFDPDDFPSTAHAKDDEFSGAVLDPKWAWAGAGVPSGSSGIYAESWGFNNGAILAVIMNDSSNWATAHRLVQACPAGDFTVTVKVNVAAMQVANVRNNFGILIDDSTDNNVALMRSAAVGSDYNALVNASWAAAASWTYDQFVSRAWGGILYLRMVKRTGKITFKYSPDGRFWTTLGDLTIAWTPVRFGIYWSYWGATVREAGASFEYFRVTEP